MRVHRLSVAGLRNLVQVELYPAAGLNLITGGNGAGKTSLLEAIHLLAYGRSFRGRVRDGLIQVGASHVEVFAEWEGVPGRIHRTGLQHGGHAWEGRVDGENVQQLGELCGPFAALTFEPGSHALLDGGGEPRRRYLDWGLFHVERQTGPSTFFQYWRHYTRALKQRNAALKQGGRAEQLEIWEIELARAGEALTTRREAYLDRLQPVLSQQMQQLVPSLGAARFEFMPGWRNQELSLADALLLGRERDRANGFTSVGPHRADWRILHAARPHQEALSRGQSKLTALACLLAQAQDYAAEQGHWPLMLLDDLAAELDATHQGWLIRHLEESQAQVFVTGTEMPKALEHADGIGLFHVERGIVR